MMSNAKICKVEFGVLSAKEILETSVCEITVGEAYDSRGIPVEKGIADPRLGVIRYNELCATCGKGIIDCTGHIGHIVLAKPVYNVLFLDEVCNLLKSVCTSCGAKRVSNEKYNIESTDSNQTKSLHGSLVCKICSAPYKAYVAEKPYFILEGLATGKNNTDKSKLPTFEHKQKLVNADEVQSIFKKISKDTIGELGLKYNPEDLLISTLVVPSIRDRPSILMDSGQRSQNDLSYKLIEIIRSNNKVKTSSAEEQVNNYYYDTLQYHCACYFDNSITNLPVSKHVGSDRPVVGLIQRLAGKPGRIRNNAVAKRVDFCARSTITPNSEIEMNEVVIPIEVAEKLTMPEVITKINYQYYYNMLKNGSTKIKTIRTPDKLKIKVLETNLEECIREFTLGCVIERQLRNGDYVIVNRQPTLHRLGLLAHKVVVKDQLTISISAGACAPYNADFDGDEMNLHAVQTVPAYCELQTLLDLKENIISVKHNKPAYGAAEDYLSGVFMLTCDDRVYSLSKVMEFLKDIDYNLNLVKPEMTGREVFSVILPSNFKLKAKNSKAQQIVIINGQLLVGSIDKALVGIGGTLLHNISKLYDQGVLFKLFCDICKLGQNVVSCLGLTAATHEYEVSDQTLDELNKFKSDKIKELTDLDRVYEKNPSNKLNLLILNKLAEFRSGCNNIVKRKFNKDNRNIYIITDSGAKGSPLNFMQITGAIGQQSISEGRVSNDYNLEKVYSSSDEQNITESKGFISSSYMSGMNATEYFSASIAAREGIIDVQLKTKISGYAERRLTHALQEVRTIKDGSVRDGSGNIIQFTAGFRGLDSTKYAEEYGICIDNFFDFSPEDFSTSSILVSDYEKLTQSLVFTVQSSRKALVLELSRLNLKPEVVESALPDIQIMLDSFKVTPFEPVGIIAAHSLSEPLSQMTLNSLNQSGTRVEQIDVGLSKLIKVIDNSSKVTSSITTLYVPSGPNSESLIESIINEVTPLYLGDFEYNIDTLKKTIAFKVDIKNLNEFGIVESNSKKYFENIMKKIAKLKACESFEVSLIESSDTEFTMEFKSLDSSAMKIDQLVLAAQNKFKLSGVSGVEDCIVVKGAEEDVIQIIGAKVKKVLKILHPKYSGISYGSNLVSEIEDLVGVEGARELIVRELKKVYDDQGMDIDLAHMELLANAMCQKGIVTSIGRRGIVGLKGSPLAKIAFEQLNLVLKDAAINNSIDPLNGILENIMVGEPVRVGTSNYHVTLK